MPDFNDVVRHVILRIVADQSGLAEEIAKARAKLKELENAERSSNSSRVKDADRVTEAYGRQSKAIGENRAAEESRNRGNASAGDAQLKRLESETQSIAAQTGAAREASAQARKDADAELARITKSEIAKKESDGRVRDAYLRNLQIIDAAQQALDDDRRMLGETFNARRDATTQIAGATADTAQARSTKAHYEADAAGSAADTAATRADNEANQLKNDIITRRVRTLSEARRVNAEINKVEQQGNVFAQRALEIEERRARTTERRAQASQRGLGGAFSGATSLIGDAATAVGRIPSATRRAVTTGTDDSAVRASVRDVDNLATRTTNVGNRASSAAGELNRLFRSTRADGEKAISVFDRMTASIKAFGTSLNRARIGGSGGNNLGDAALRSFENVTAGLSGALSGVNKHLFSFQTLITSAIVALGPLAAIMGAVGAAGAGLAADLVSLAGVLGTLPGLLTSAIAGFGALYVAIKPLSGVLSAYSAAQKAATTNANDAADAALDYSNAVLTQQNAQIAYNRAVADQPRLEQKLADARKEATRTLEDYHSALQKVKYDQEGAQLDVESAEQSYRAALADPTKSSLERRQARHDYEGALYDQKDTNTTNERLVEDSTEAFKKGVDGADAVVAAQQAVEDSTNAIKTAYNDWQKSIIAVTKADAARAAGSTAAATAMQTYLDKLAELGPNTRKVAEAIVGLDSGWKDLKKSLSEALFGPISKDTDKFATALDELKTFLTPAAEAFGQLADAALKLFTSDEWKNFFSSQGKEAGSIIQTLGGAALDLAEGFKAIVELAKPMTDFVVNGIAGMADQFARFSQSKDGRDSISSFFATTMRTMRELKPVVRDLFLGFAGFFTALTDGGGKGDSFTTKLNSGLAGMAKTFRELGEEASKPGSGFRKWLADVGPLIKNVAHFIGAVGTFFGDLFSDPDNLKEAEKLLHTISEQWLPKLAEIFDNLSKSGFISKLATGIGAAFDAITKFFNGGGIEAFTVFTGSLQKAGEWLSAIVGFFTAMPGVIQTIGTVIAVVFGAALIAKFSGITTVLKGILGLVRSVNDFRENVQDPANSKTSKTASTGTSSSSSRRTSTTGTSSTGTSSTGTSRTRRLLNAAKTQTTDAVLGRGESDRVMARIESVLGKIENYARLIEINTRKYGKGTASTGGTGGTGGGGGGGTDDDTTKRTTTTTGGTGTTSKTTTTGTTGTTGTTEEATTRRAQTGATSTTTLTGAAGRQAIREQMNTTSAKLPAPAVASTATRTATSTTTLPTENLTAEQQQARRNATVSGTTPVTSVSGAGTTVAERNVARVKAGLTPLPETSTALITPAKAATTAATTTEQQSAAAARAARLQQARTSTGAYGPGSTGLLPFGVDTTPQATKTGTFIKPFPLERTTADASSITGTTEPTKRTTTTRAPVTGSSAINDLTGVDVSSTTGVAGRTRAQEVEAQQREVAANRAAREAERAQRNSPTGVQQRLDAVAEASATRKVIPTYDASGQPTSVTARREQTTATGETTTETSRRASTTTATPLTQGQANRSTATSESAAQKRKRLAQERAEARNRKITTTQPTEANTRPTTTTVADTDEPETTKRPTKRVTADVTDLPSGTGTPLTDVGRDDSPYTYPGSSEATTTVATKEQTGGKQPSPPRGADGKIVSPYKDAANPSLAMPAANFPGQRPEKDKAKKKQVQSRTSTGTFGPMVDVDPSPTGTGKPTKPVLADVGEETTSKTRAESRAKTTVKKTSRVKTAFNRAFENLKSDDSGSISVGALVPGGRRDKSTTVSADDDYDDGYQDGVRSAGGTADDGTGKKKTRKERRAERKQARRSSRGSSSLSGGPVDSLVDDLFDDDFADEESNRGRRASSTSTETGRRGRLGRGVRSIGRGIGSGLGGGIAGLALSGGLQMGGEALVNKFVKNDADASSLQRGLGAVSNGVGIGSTIGSLIPIPGGAAIGGLVGGAVGGIYSLFKDKNLRDFVGEKLSKVGSMIADGFKAGLKEAGKFFSAIGSWFAGIGKSIGDFFASIGSWIAKAAGKVGDFFTKTIPHYAGQGAKFVLDKFLAFVKFWYVDLPLKVLGFFLKLAVMAANGVKWLLDKFVDFLKFWYVDLPLKVLGFFAQLGQWALEGGQKLLDAFWRSLTFWTVDVPKAIWNFFTDTLPTAAAQGYVWMQKTFGDPVRNFIKNDIPKFFTDTIPGWFASVGEWFGKHVITPLTDFFAVKIPGFFTQTLPDALKSVPGKIYDAIIAPVVEFFKGLKQHISITDLIKGPGALWDWAKSLFTSGKMSGGLIEGVYQGIQDSALTPTTPGEYVVRKSKVDEPGAKAFLSDFNEHGMSALYAGLSAQTAPNVMSLVPPDAQGLTGVVPTVVNNTVNHAPLMGDVTINNPVRERSDSSLRRQVQLAAIRHRR